MDGKLTPCPGAKGMPCVNTYLRDEAGEPVEACPKCSPILDAAGHPLVTKELHTNVMGHMHTATNAKQQEYVQRVRDLGLEFYALLHEAGGTDPNAERFATRRLSMAATDMETAVMYAVKGICERS